MEHFWPSISFWKHWFDGMGACRKRRASMGSVSDPEAAFIQECLLAPFDHAQPCSSSSGNLGKYERYSKGHNYSLDIWISCPVGKTSTVLISDLMECLGVLLFTYTIMSGYLWLLLYIISEFSSCPALKNYKYQKNKSVFKAYSFHQKDRWRCLHLTKCPLFILLYNPIIKLHN